MDNTMTPRLVELVRATKLVCSILESSGHTFTDAEFDKLQRAALKAERLADEASRLMAEGGLSKEPLAPKGAALEVPEGFVLIPKTALEWLYGSGPDDQGSWFGECEDCVKDGRAKYWWRRHIRKIIERGRASLLQASEGCGSSNPVDDGAVERGIVAANKADGAPLICWNTIRAALEAAEPHP